MKNIRHSSVGFVSGIMVLAGIIAGCAGSSSGTTPPPVTDIVVELRSANGTVSGAMDPATRLVNVVLAGGEVRSAAVPPGVTVADGQLVVIIERGSNLNANYGASNVFGAVNADPLTPVNATISNLGVLERDIILPGSGNDFTLDVTGSATSRVLTWQRLVITGKVIFKGGALASTFPTNIVGRNLNNGQSTQNARVETTHLAVANGDFSQSLFVDYGNGQTTSRPPQNPNSENKVIYLGFGHRTIPANGVSLIHLNSSHPFIP
ncbi:MAG: hypothetical protein ACK4XJ_04010 [Fimbriimonadaceae bacterium]